MKLLVTENLVSDINKLNSFNIALEKMSIKDITSKISKENNISKKKIYK